MGEAYIVAAVGAAGAKRNGRASGWRPADLAGIVLDDLVALGHPLSASGTKLMTTLVHALAAHGKRYGLQTMCEGGGMANVTIVERL
jgi:acetyl-CoA C-acetyltransferase